MAGFRISGPTRSPAERAVLGLTLLAALAIALPATGCTLTTQTWRAKVGASGANGTATLTLNATGPTATLKLALKALTASTAYPVKVVKGTCATPGSALWAAPTQRATAAGKIAKSLVVPSAKLAAIVAGAAAGPFAIRVGSGSRLRCGPFTVVGPPPTPTPTPCATQSPGQSGGTTTFSPPQVRTVSRPTPRPGVGLTWTMLPAGEALPRDTEPVDVVSGPAGFVVEDDQHRSGGDQPRVWHSADARAWKQAAFEAGGWGISLTGFPWGYVILDLPSPYRASGIGNTGIWVSTDGESWCRLGEIPGMAWTIVDTGTKLVAAGTTIGPPDASGSLPLGVPSAWASTDGSSWTRADLLGPEGGSIESLAVTEAGLVALTRDGFHAGALRAWKSSDGLTWSGGSPVPGMESLETWGIQQVPSGGYLMWVMDSTHTELWGSPDFVTWTRIADLGTFGYRASARGGDGLLVFGVENVGGHLWRRVVQTSSDGRVWRTVATDAFDSRPHDLNTGTNRHLTVNAAAWTGDQVIAVGCDGRGLEGMAAFDECVGAVWVSPGTP